MSDNTQYNAGSGGDVLASDDIGGVKYPRVKVSLGADGAAADLAVTNPMPIGGDIAHDVGDSGNPVKVGVKALSAMPTAVTTADRCNAIGDLYGRQGASHIDAGMFVSRSFNATTTQAGTDVWSPASGKRIAVTSAVIGTYGNTAARLILWFGPTADTTYTAGTDQVLLDASFAPVYDALYPGLVFTPPSPVFATADDYELHCTTDAALAVDIVVHGYEYTVPFTFEPTSLALTGYWRANYTGAPWVGTASAGTSGSQDLTIGDAAPSTGSAVNGYTPADFDGTDDELIFEGTIDTYFSSSLLSAWFLIWFDTADSQIVYDSSDSRINIFKTTAEGVGISYNNGDAVPIRACATGAWKLVTVRANGSNVAVGVNEAPGAAGGASSVVHAGTLSSLTGTLTFGTTFGAGQLNAKVLEVGFSDIALTDQNFTDIKTYCNARYGLSL